MVVEIYNKKGKHYRDKVNKTRFMERDTQLRNMKNESGKETKHQVAKKMKLTLGLATYFNNHVCRGVANHSRVAECTRLSLEGVYSGVS